jgi:hypothetical protein
MKFKVKILFFFLFYSLPVIVYSQKKNKNSRIRIEAIGSVLFDSERWFNHNEEEDYFYGEFRIGYRFTHYIEANVFIGYEKRHFGYFAQQNANLYLLDMERHYTPVGINFRLDLSDFFYELLKLWKKKGKWDIYNQIGFAVLKEKDIRDNREEFYRNQGAYVPYFLYPYVERNGQKYFTYMAGIRYNFSKKLGIFIEGGQGAFKDLQIGISAKF